VGRDFIKTNSGGVTFASGSGNGTGTLNVERNFSATEGILIKSSAGTGNINFSGNGVQTYVGGANVASPFNYTINSGVILDLGTNVLGPTSGTLGTFVCNGTVRVGSVAPSGAVNGNIPIANKTFNAGSTIVYNGTALQSMSFST